MRTSALVLIAACALGACGPSKKPAPAPAPTPTAIAVPTVIASAPPPAPPPPPAPKPDPRQWLGKYEVVARLAPNDSVQLFEFSDGDLIVVSDGHHPGDAMRAAWVTKDAIRAAPEALAGLPPHGSINLGTLKMGFSSQSPYVTGSENFGRRSIAAIHGDRLDGSWLISEVSGKEPTFDCAHEIFRREGNAWKRQGPKGKKGHCLANHWRWTDESLLLLWHEKGVPQRFTALGHAAKWKPPSFRLVKASYGGRCAQGVAGALDPPMHVFRDGNVVSIKGDCHSGGLRLTRWSGTSPRPSAKTFPGLTGSDLRLDVKRDDKGHVQAHLEGRGSLTPNKKPKKFPRGMVRTTATHDGKRWTLSKVEKAPRPAQRLLPRQPEVFPRKQAFGKETIRRETTIARNSGGHYVVVDRIRGKDDGERLLLREGAVGAPLQFDAPKRN